MVPLHGAREAAALRDAGDVDQLACREESEGLADGEVVHVLDPELADGRHLRQVTELAGLGLVSFARLRAELDGRVAVAVGRAQPGHGVWARARTLTGIIVPSSWNSWVMPTLRPMSPMRSHGLITS